jgi:hypothetical protein
LVNGGFEQWQRGTGPFVTTGATGNFGADRWQQYVQISGGNLSVAPDNTNMDTGSARCAACTNSATAPTTATPSFLYNMIVDSEGLELRGRTVSYSARIKCSVANACRIAIMDTTTTTYLSAYHPGDGVYHTLTITGAAIGTTANNCQARVYFENNGTFYIDNAMLAVGTTAADYVPLHPADDLARCLRYFQQYGSQNGGWSFMMGQCLTTTSFMLQRSVPFLAITPTVTVVNPLANYGVANSAGGIIPTTALAMWLYTPGTLNMNGNVASGLVAGNATYLMASGNNPAFINVEANP